MVKGLVFSVASKLVLHPWYRLTRGLTLGVRGAVRDAEGRYLLVRHTYAPGWMFPGGGIERGELLATGMVRELAEETGVISNEPPELFGIYANFERFPGDHVALFVVSDFQRTDWKPGLEIAAAEFFPVKALPADTTGGTRRRIREISENLPPAAHW